MDEIQLHPQSMFNKMVAIIPIEKDNFRTVPAEEFEIICKNNQERQYVIQTNQLDESKNNTC